jgi:hypothetical protein
VQPSTLREAITDTAAQLSTSGLAFSSRASFGGRRGAFLVYEFPSSEVSRRSEAHRACRVLEILNDNARDSSAVRCDHDLRLAVRLDADDAAVDRLAELANELLTSAVRRAQLLATGRRDPVGRPGVVEDDLDLGRRRRADERLGRLPR